MSSARTLPLLSRVSSIRLAFNPTKPDHVSCRLFYASLDTDRLRTSFATAKIVTDIAESVKDPKVEVQFVNGELLSLETRELTANEIQDRLRRAIRRVINSEV